MHTEFSETTKIRIGVIGVRRGESMIGYCERSGHAVVTAICDNWEHGLNEARKKHGDGITYDTSYDEFLKRDFDVVVLANYATEHAPFAVKALRAGKHVISEVLPVQTCAEAVELIETIEETGLTYLYLENYCYMPAPLEMKRLYRAGVIGEFEYGEGEYIHNCEAKWPGLTFGSPDHWRNNMFSTYYCTHSLGPLIHITGMRPVEVTGFEPPYSDRSLRMGKKSPSYGIEMVRLENGAMVRSVHGGLYKDSIWYCVYGSKGRLESAREDTGADDISRIYYNVDRVTAAYGTPDNTEKKNYPPRDGLTEKAAGYGHGGSDYYSMWNAVEKLRGSKNADVIDIYEALDMALPGIFAYFSILAGGVPMQVPDFRDPAVRERYRHDNRCTDPKKAGDQLIPTCSTERPEIPEEIYAGLHQKWLDSNMNRF